MDATREALLGVALFGLFKRRRAKSSPPRTNMRPATPDTQAPADEAQREAVGRSWYNSSRDLHEGLYVNEDADDVTVPAPLDHDDGKHR